MRGKANAVGLLHLGFRITPAYAGKRVHTDLSACSVRDHPRLCGEKLDSAVENPQQPGSPPPMRGKVLRGSMIRRMSGITPAYAGKRQLLHM